MHSSNALMFDVDDEGNYQLNTKYVRTQLEVEQKGEKIKKVTL